MKKFLVMLMAMLAVMVMATFLPLLVFGQTAEGWVEESLVPKCVAVVVEDGLGTGIFVTEDGYIVTCLHVVRGAKNVVVYTSDFRKYKGRIVGFHSEVDVAVIKIESTALLNCFDFDAEEVECVVPLNRVFLGEDVYAIGMPFGMAWTVSRGIISQKRKDARGTIYWQTDASINPGNSGGPLLDSIGRVIGINSIGYPAWMVENIAFTIAAPTWVDEVLLLIGQDRERLQIIEDVNKYIEEKDLAARYSGGGSYH